MNSSLIATRYAKALYQVGLSNPLVMDSVYIDCSYLKRVLKESHDLEQFLKNSVIRQEKKITVFKSLFESQLHEFTLNFVINVIRNNREALIMRMIERFINFYRDHKGIKCITVIAAVPLDLSKHQEISETIGTQLKCVVELECRTDPNIIGGIVLLMDGKMVDGSVAGQLRTMRKLLAN